MSISVVLLRLIALADLVIGRSHLRQTPVRDPRPAPIREPVT
jgi:hypothetical protein